MCWGLADGKKGSLSAVASTSEASLRKPCHDIALLWAVVREVASMSSEKSAESVMMAVVRVTTTECHQTRRNRRMVGSTHTSSPPRFNSILKPIKTGGTTEKRSIPVGIEGGAPPSYEPGERSPPSLLYTLCIDICSSSRGGSSSDWVLNHFGVTSSITNPSILIALLSHGLHRFERRLCKDMVVTEGGRTSEQSHVI